VVIVTGNAVATGVVELVEVGIVDTSNTGVEDAASTAAERANLIGLLILAGLEDKGTMMRARVQAAVGDCCSQHGKSGFEFPYYLMGVLCG